MKKNCQHNFKAINNNSVGFFGILLFCTKCGKPYSYNSDWELYKLGSDEDI